MGLGSDWKDLLKKRYPEAWHHSIPENVKVDIVIDDLNQSIRKAINRATNEPGSLIIKRVVNYMHRIQDVQPDIKRYIMVIDEPKYVPPCKAVEQRERDANGAEPFSDEDLRRFNISLTEKGILPDMDRFIATRSLRPELFRFVTCSLMHNPFNRRGFTPVVLEIDGAVVEQSTGDSRTLERKRVILQHMMNPWIGESSQIGEGEVKIVKHTSVPHDGTYYIRACDSDLIPLLLLAAKEWIDAETGQIHKRVYLNTSRDEIWLNDKLPSRNQKAGPVKSAETLLDVVQLWRCILYEFREKYPQIKDPIEVMVLMMILRGTDYTEGLQGIGAVTIMDTLDYMGNNVLYDSCPPFTKNLSVDCTEHQCDIIFAEHKIYQWIVALYYCKIYGTKLDNLDVFSLETSTKARRNGKYSCRLEDTMNYLRKQKLKYPIPPDQNLVALIRRIYWNMDYWINGWKLRGYKPPLAVDSETGLSLYGWKNSTVNEGNKLKTVVVLDNTVHVRK